MCEIFSGIGTRTGQLYTSDVTDSHNDLFDIYNLREQQCTPVEFLLGTDPTDVSTYTFRFDAERPAWADDEWVERIKAEWTRRIEKMIVRDKRKILAGGCWILGDGAVVGQTISVRLVVMQGTSQVGGMWGTSQVGVMQGTSQAGVMWGTSRVGEMRDSSQVGVMWGTSRVGEMRDSSQVGVMQGTSQVGVMWGTSRVGEMRDSSQVGVMWDTSQVGVMFENARAPRRLEAPKQVDPATGEAK